MNSLRTPRKEKADSDEEGLERVKPETPKNWGKEFSSPIVTPKANIEFSKELKQVLHERNLLTTRTKKRVFDVLDEIEVTQKCEGVQRKRENAIFEIIISEKTYVQQLSVIVNFFMKPTREKKLLPDTDFEILFGNIYTIFSLNQALLKELYKGSLNVANAFLQIAPYFKLYSSYAREYKKMLDVLQRSRIRNPEFCKFMEMQETRPEVQNKLSALLITPIQRIPRYKLLLKQLHELTSPSDVDFDNILMSLQKVKEAADHINKVVDHQENLQRLLEVQRLFKNGEPAIITPGRELKKEGVLIQFDGKEGPSRKFYVVLLNDIILFCKLKSSTFKPNSLKCNMIFPLNKCTIIENVEKGCFQIHCHGDNIILYDKEVYVTKDWINSITEAIDECLEKRKTLRKGSSARRPVKRKDLNEYSDVGLSPGLPLRKRRRTIDQTQDDNFPIITRRRSIRSLTPSVQTLENHLPETQIVNNTSVTTNNDSDSNTVQNSPNTEVFVFGQENARTNFTFKLTNMISNIGSSVMNIFKFRR